MASLCHDLQHCLPTTNPRWVVWVARFDGSLRAKLLRRLSGLRLVLRCPLWPSTLEHCAVDEAATIQLHIAVVGVAARLRWLDLHLWYTLVGRLHR